MKKIALTFFTLTLLLFSINNVFANPEGTIKVSVPIDFSSVFGQENSAGVSCSTGDNGKHYCNVPKGTSGFQVVMAGIIKYTIFITSLAGVLFIVINGILYSMSGMNDSFKTEAKDRIVKTLIGIIILLMSGVILNILAPWVYG